MESQCRGSLARTCCSQFFCKPHYKQHIVTVHNASAFYQQPTTEELEAIDTGLQAISQSRRHFLVLELGKPTSPQNITASARRLRELVSSSETDYQALQEMKTKGIPATSRSRLPSRFVKALRAPKSQLTDEFLWELAKLGYISASIADALLRRSQVRVEAEESNPSLLQDLERCLEIQTTLSVSVSKIALTRVVLGKALLAIGNWQLAEAQATKALQDAPDNVLVKADGYLVLGWVQHRKGNQLPASKYLAQAAYAQQESATTLETRRMASINLGLAYELQGKFDRALLRFEKAKKRTVELYGLDDLRTAYVNSHIARLFLRTEKNKSAENLYIQILPILENHGNSSYLKEVYRGLRRIYSVARHNDKLLMYSEQLFRLLQPHEWLEQVEVLRNLVDTCNNMELHDKVRQYSGLLCQIDHAPSSGGIVYLRKPPILI